MVRGGNGMFMLEIHTAPSYLIVNSRRQRKGISSCYPEQDVRLYTTGPRIEARTPGPMPMWKNHGFMQNALAKKMGYPAQAAGTLL